MNLLCSYENAFSIQWKEKKLVDIFEVVSKY